MILGKKIFLGQKKFWVKKKFGSKKCWFKSWVKKKNIGVKPNLTVGL